MPAEPIPMPMHQATRLEFLNPERISALGAAAAGRLRFTLRIESRDIEQVPARHAWRTTVRATILAICALRER